MMPQENRSGIHWNASCISIRDIAYRAEYQTFDEELAGGSLNFGKFWAL
jgi:hypothetical protein